MTKVYSQEELAKEYETPEAKVIEIETFGVLCQDSNGASGTTDPWGRG